MFREGKLKPGGEREEAGRAKKRSHQTTLVQGNHFLLNTFFEAESIEQEDGELTSMEVTAAIIFTSMPRWIARRSKTTPYSL